MGLGTRWCGRAWGEEGKDAIVGAEATTPSKTSISLPDGIMHSCRQAYKETTECCCCCPPSFRLLIVAYMSLFLMLPNHLPHLLATIHIPSGQTALERKSHQTANALNLTPLYPLGVVCNELDLNGLRFGPWRFTVYDFGFRFVFLRCWKEMKMGRWGDRKYSREWDLQESQPEWLN